MGGTIRAAGTLITWTVPRDPAARRRPGRRSAAGYLATIFDAVIVFPFSVPVTITVLPAFSARAGSV
jgi:hypothetical protein